MALIGKPEEVIAEMLAKRFQRLFTEYETPYQRLMKKQAEQGCITGKDVVEACKASKEQLTEMEG